MDVSILICTRNRANFLRDTLQSLAATSIPSSWQVELVIVDNGSTDATPTVIAREAPKALNPRRIVEPTPGLSHARNTGIEATTGNVILFTDDDVRVPQSWIEPMATPILEDRADAVAGGVQLADALQREWMSDLHASLLADTAPLQKRGEVRLVGANMAIARSVFDRFPGFDPELGAGRHTLGFHEETLVSLQMKQTDQRIETAYDVLVKHCPQPDRIQRDAYIQAAGKLGRSDAYLDYHWRHAEGQWLRSAVAKAVWSATLWAYRCLAGRAGGEEGMDPIKMDLRRRKAYHHQMMRLVGTPRKYEQYGVRKHSLPTSTTENGLQVL